MQVLIYEYTTSMKRLTPFLSLGSFILWGRGQRKTLSGISLVCPPHQSVTSRLENSRYRDFSQFFESIGLGLKYFGLDKKSRYRSQKYFVSKKVSVSVSKIFSLEKKSRYRSRKYLVSKKVTT